ncbi:MAG TPA: sugar ABC transporter substrate-binding protein [Anaerolineae bacterium]|nr:sugar ABC transporter substrate-binding protein [Anaerolineae bacterium]HQK14346.1 sugar ABC transporter substrate-binding protein [Anaerolineae bacterium]
MFHNKAIRHYIKLWVLVLIFAGCAKTLPTPEPVTIKFPYYERDAAYYTALAEQFHARYPSITVELVKLGRQNINQVGDNDVFMANQLSVPQLIQQGAILNLTPLIEQDKTFDSNVFYPGTLETFQYEGKTWGIPSDIDVLLMYYNKDLFDRYGVPYPTIGWTWDDFLDRAESLTDPGSGIFGYAIQYEDQMAIMEPVLFIYQHGGQLFDSWQNPTHITFNDPLNVEALAWYAALIHTYNVAPTRQQGPNSIGYYPYGGIMQGKFGMWMGMLSEHGGVMWPTRWPMRWGAVPLPRDRNATTLATVNGFFISTKTQHPEACWKWITFLSASMPTQNIPARTALAESNEFLELVGADTAEAARAAVREAVLINPNLVGYEQALNTLGAAFTAVREGQTSPEAALNAAQEQIDF